MEIVATKSNRGQMHVRVEFIRMNFTLEISMLHGESHGYIMTGGTGTESGDIVRDHG